MPRSFVNMRARSMVMRVASRRHEIVLAILLIGFSMCLPLRCFGFD